MAEYFVNPVGGDDSKDGLSLANAWKSTAKAASSVAAGDTVRLCATGTEALTGTNTITIAVAGTNAPGGAVVWLGCDASGEELSAGSYYTISGAGMDANTDILTLSASYNFFRHVSLIDARRYAVFSNLAISGDQFQSCRIAGALSALFCISTNGSDTKIFDCILRDSPYAIYTSTTNRGVVTIAVGCLFKNITTSVIKSCLMPHFLNCIFDTCAGGLSQFNITSGIVDHCTFYGCTVAIRINDREATGCYDFITNCAFVNCTYAIQAYNNVATLGTIHNSHNLFWGCTNNYTGGVTAGEGDVLADPLFKDAANGDFTPLAGSPLIGAGMNGSTIGAVSPAAGGGNVIVIED